MCEIVRESSLAKKLKTEVNFSPYVDYVNSDISHAGT